MGHETDFTIADFVADLRAPTPSAAAELAVDDFRSVAESVFLYRQRFYRAMSNQLDSDRNRLKQLQMRLGYLSPQSRLREQRQRLVDLEDAVRGGMDRKMKGYRHELELYLERFGGLSPLRKLNQGFAYVADQNRKTLTSVEQVKNGDTIYVSVTDRTIEAQVCGTETFSEFKETSLEDSFRLYKKVWSFWKYCSELDTVEKKMLQMNEDGTLREF